jgi:hypothetical protein
MNKKIIIAIMAMGLVITGVYTIINVSRQSNDLVAKANKNLYGKWKLDTFNHKPNSLFDSSVLDSIYLNFENDSIATLTQPNDSSQSLKYFIFNDTISIKLKESELQKFTYTLKDSLLKFRYLNDSLTFQFRQVQ